MGLEMLFSFFPWNTRGSHIFCLADSYLVTWKEIRFPLLKILSDLVSK